MRKPLIILLVAGTVLGTTHHTAAENSGERPRSLLTTAPAQSDIFIVTKCLPPPSQTGDGGSRKQLGSTTSPAACGRQAFDSANSSDRRVIQRSRQIDEFHPTSSRSRNTFWVHSTNSQPLDGQEVNSAVGDSASELIGDPEVEAVLESLRRNNTEIQTKTVSETVIKYETRTIRRGLFGRRICVVRVPVEVTRTREIQVEVTRIERGIGWEDPNDPRMGFWEKDVSLVMLPAAAGARASRIEVAAIPLLPTHIANERSVDDRVLTISSTDFSDDNAPPGIRHAFRIIAKVQGSRYDSVRLTVMLQQIDSQSETPVSDKVMLNGLAMALFQQIEMRLVQ